MNVGHGVYLPVDKLSEELSGADNIHLMKPSAYEEESS
jgi:hypothetical protein